MDIVAVDKKTLGDYLELIIKVTFPQLLIELDESILDAFIQDESKRSLYVCKDERGFISFQPSATTLLAFIKRFPKLDHGNPLQDQLLMMNWPQLDTGSSGYTVLFDYLHYAFGPYFEKNSYLQGEGENKAGMSFVTCRISIDKEETGGIGTLTGTFTTKYCNSYHKIET